MMPKPDRAEELATFCRIHGLPEPVREFRFCARKWRIDLAWPEEKLAVEIEGGVWTKGRHTRPKGFLGDLEKYNSLSLLGWSLLRFTPQQVRTGEAVTVVVSWFGSCDRHGADADVRS